MIAFVTAGEVMEIIEELLQDPATIFLLALLAMIAAGRVGMWIEKVRAEREEALGAKNKD